MLVSVFDLFKVGIGPSSSHTVGPMKAAHRFVRRLADEGCLPQVTRLMVELYGSLSATGRGHATDTAVLLGLEGAEPQTIDPATIDARVRAIRTTGRLCLAGEQSIAFDETRDVMWIDRALPPHPNGVRLVALGSDGTTLLAEVYFSVGGGFIATGDELMAVTPAVSDELPYGFASAAELLAIGERTGWTLAEIVRANERRRLTDAEIDTRLDGLWDVMQGCIERGCQQAGVLPGGLNVPRRAPGLYARLKGGPNTDPLTQLDWVSLFALAVNEENAAGGRVVTAPTNGAAGVIPAVLAYYDRFVPGASAEGRRTFLLTAGAIGMLYKRNASLSAAEMGCQGEVGVACSMAAAGLAAVMGGSNAQIENAAEIGMEHHLGLTCDPIAGLVQVPCIERNTMGAAKALNAARLAVLYGDGMHRVPLDKVIETMRQTGRDMQDKYKETSRGGLALNMVDC